VSTQTARGQEIEERSFAIIDAEVGQHPYSALEWPVVRRAIHATADFEFARGSGLIFHPEAIAAGLAALRAGKPVIADVDMVRVGINMPRLTRYGGSVHCFIGDPDVIDGAKREGTTRAVISMRKAAPLMEGAVVVNGNAPTALLEVVRLVRAGEVRPGLIVGVPVGFVSAPESKQALLGLPVPYITNPGRKGGSTVAIAIVNALLALADEKT
jgi:precorrin-8X/cobalt-precorrin-8 methylmutase